MAILSENPGAPVAHYPVIIIGGGAAGLVAALAARDGGSEVLVIERDPTPRGTTAMSTGLIPAAGTPDQAEAGVTDSADTMAKDIIAKAGTTDDAVVHALAAQSAEVIGWLKRQHGVPLSLVTGFLYPGHSNMRMMGTPHRTGEELMAGLNNACAAAGVDILTDAQARDLVADAQGRVTGVVIQRPDGATETVTCNALILACSGFAGNAEMVARFIPEIHGAVFHGHPGNKGDAVAWGEALGAAVKDMDAYQGHGGLAAGHGIPILWPLIMEGGIQVNRAGQRFADESRGYSVQAANIVAQPGSVAWSVYDARCDAVMRQFDDYTHALSAGAIVEAPDLAILAAKTGLPEAALTQTLADVAAMVRSEKPCPFGRNFPGKPELKAPFFAARVNGALFHTQGGLAVDTHARVLRPEGTPLPNLFAAGGAARGISGPGAAGYIAGNGLLSATGLGYLAGKAAARS
ncbi:MAG: FAD-dependent oxidoreductase [Polymorphobacter sp.]|uniref:FAD-dependent oxidoreductase n=1 Tax=Polymorphobacter sp. TaxID=1909290 RepID=UPI003A879530